MRIWHEELIPLLCQKHLCAMWRESLGCYKILMENKKGYRKHPQVIEFENNTAKLVFILEMTRGEMLSRGYSPKYVPVYNFIHTRGKYEPWQTLEEQIAILKSKGCHCNV